MIIYIKHITVYELDANAWEYEDTMVTTRTIDANTAISTLISKLSIYNGLYCWFYFLNGKILLYNKCSIYERAFYFLRKNCNGVLRDLQEDTANFLVGYSSNSFQVQNL